MAKVTGPLMSIEASGQFAQSIVFDKRGFARGYTIPSNPRTTLQQETRLAMKAAQTAARHLNATARTTLEGILGYRWNAALLGETLGTNLSNYTASALAYDSLTEQEKGYVTALASTLQMTEVAVPGSTGTVEPEIPLYAVLRAYNNLTAPATPVTVANIGTLFT